jgi:hypothetical protein
MYARTQKKEDAEGGLNTEKEEGREEKGGKRKRKRGGL